MVIGEEFLGVRRGDEPSAGRTEEGILKGKP